MLLQNRFNQIDNQIATVESEIAKLQAQLSELQNHRQHLQSVEQACESALAQVDTALMMLNHVDPECVATFKDALTAKFNGAIATLTEAPTDIEAPSEPIEPEPSDTIDITATEASEPDPEVTDPETEDTEPSEPFASVGAAGFNPMTADFDALKRWVRSHQGDDTTRKQGSLNRRTTWKAAAKAIMTRI